MESPKTSSITESFGRRDIPGPIGVVCHDAGGANQIFAMLRETGLLGITAWVEGPAATLWRAIFPHAERVASVTSLTSNVRTLITSTGWASRLEHDARKAASALGVHSIAVLDHWTNYRDRFVRDGEIVLPDEIWVVDEYALAIAGREFPSSRITLQPDWYAEQQSRNILPPPATSNELLYLLEPARSDWGRGELGEFQALRFFLGHLWQMSLPEDIAIRLRPHPSDPPGKYAAFLDDKGPPRVLEDVGDLAESMSRARWVAGCQTYAMTLALRNDRTVYCTLPPWAPVCSLPHSGLIHLKDIARG